MIGMLATVFLAGVFGPAVNFCSQEPQAMALAREGNCLYGGAGDTLIVFDVTQAHSPRMLGEVHGMAGIRQIAVQNGFAYVTAREYGLWIVDCTNPSQPRIRSRFDTCELATGIDVAGDVAFCGQRQNGVEFIDVSDPDRPERIAMRKTDESQSVKYCDGWLYSGEWAAGKVTVFDAHDMSDIRQVTTVDLHGYGDGIWIQDGYLYAARGHHSKHRTVKGGVITEEMRRFGGPKIGGGMGHGLDVFDLKDPARPRRVGEVDYPPFYARGLDMWTPRLSGSLLVAAQTHNGLFAVNVEDPANPVVLDRWCIPAAGHPEWPSACVSSVAIGNGVVYVAVKGEGFFAIPCKDAVATAFDKGVLPKHSDFRESYPTDMSEWHVWKPSGRTGQCRAAAVRGDVVYAAFGDAGLYALEVLPEERGFREIGTLGESVKVYDAVVEGDLLFTAEGPSGFGFYDVSAGGFREVARIDRISAAKPLALNIWKPAKDWLVASDRRGVAVYDVTDLSDIRQRLFVRGAPGWDRYFVDRAVGNSRYAAYNNANTSVKWIDLAAATGPEVSVETRMNRLKLTNGVCAFGEGVLASTDGGYYLLEPNQGDADDGKPWEKIALPSDISGIPRSDGRRLLLTSRIYRRAALFDCEDPRHPRLLHDWRFKGCPDLGTFYKGRVIIPCGYEGLLMQRGY